MATSNLPASKSGLFADPREDWLAQRKEEILDLARPIVDPHHHFWDRGGQRYLIEEIAADIASGHNIIATVYVEARSMYRAGGPEALRPVGEVEFANGSAAMSASGGYGPAAICAGIVGHANLLLGEAARDVLEAEIAAGNGRFRGIRHSSPWDADPNVAGMYALRPKASARSNLPQGLCLPRAAESEFRCLAVSSADRRTHRSRPRLSEYPNRARSLRRPDRHRQLRQPARGNLHGLEGSIRDIAKCPNVFVKLGGLAMRLLGYDFHERPMPPSSEESGRGVASLYRDLHRGLRPRARDVREQFSAR